MHDTKLHYNPDDEENQKKMSKKKCKVRCGLGNLNNKTILKLLNNPEFLPRGISRPITRQIYFCYGVRIYGRIDW